MTFPSHIIQVLSHLQFFLLGLWASETTGKHFKRGISVSCSTLGPLDISPIGFFFFNVYLFLRQRHSMNRGGAEREGDIESEIGSRLRAISPEPHAGLELTDREIVTWLKSDA